MDDIRTLFALEDAAMFPLGSWEIPVVLEMNPDLDLGYFLFHLKREIKQ